MIVFSLPLKEVDLKSGGKRERASKEGALVFS
jgi:hypothetical protein